MLKITIPENEFFDEKNQVFVTIKGQTLQLEHSLVSISKWESKWHKPFLSNSKERTNEEIIDYIKCMTLTQNVDPLIYNYLPKEAVDKITNYIQDPMTATWFPADNTKKHSREIVTSEIIYHWMISLNIPFECQKWHINRLLTLIEVCNVKNQPKKKMSKRDVYNQNRALNAARKQRLNTKG